MKLSSLLICSSLVIQIQAATFNVINNGAVADDKPDNTAATETFIALRLFLPVQPQTVEIDWIEAQSAEGKKRWDF